MLTVACVLRSGGDFDVRYVNRLAKGVHEHLPIQHRFVCLTDHPREMLPGIETVALEHGWPGWWSKMELFRLPGPVLYFDLDTVIVGDLSTLARSVTGDLFAMLSDFYRPNLLSSGVLAWGGDETAIFGAFQLSARGRWNGARLTCGSVRYRGDQEWLREYLKCYPDKKVTTVQSIEPGVVSYKVRVRPMGEIPEGAKVVCFHGQPRPHEVEWLETVGVA